VTTYSHETFISPFTWRYGSPEMRAIWSEMHKRRLWRRIWVALAEVQAEAGLVTPEQAADLAAHAQDIDWQRAQELERDLRHDLMAEVRTYAEQCAIGGGIIHLGATSMDVEDNADALRVREALQLLATQSAGGKYLDIDELEQMPSLIPRRTTSLILTGQPTVLWDRWWTLAVLVILLGVEWLVRKRSHLL